MIQGNLLKVGVHLEYNIGKKEVILMENILHQEVSG